MSGDPQDLAREAVKLTQQNRVRPGIREKPEFVLQPENLRECPSGRSGLTGGGLDKLTVQRHKALLIGLEPIDAKAFHFNNVHAVPPSLDPPWLLVSPH